MSRQESARTHNEAKVSGRARVGPGRQGQQPRRDCAGAPGRGRDRMKSCGRTSVVIHPTMRGSMMGEGSELTPWL